MQFKGEEVPRASSNKLHASTPQLAYEWCLIIHWVGEAALKKLPANLPMVLLIRERA